MLRGGAHYYIVAGKWKEGWFLLCARWVAAQDCNIGNILAGYFESVLVHFVPDQVRLVMQSAYASGVRDSISCLLAAYKHKQLTFDSCSVQVQICFIVS